MVSLLSHHMIPITSGRLYSYVLVVLLLCFETTWVWFWFGFPYLKSGSGSQFYALRSRPQSISSVPMVIITSTTSWRNIFTIVLNAQSDSWIECSMLNLSFQSIKKDSLVFGLDLVLNKHLILFLIVFYASFFYAVGSDGSFAQVRKNLENMMF